MSIALDTIITEIEDIIQDSSYTEAILITRLNDAARNIAAGVRIASGMVSPPLPGLYDTDTVTTSTTLPYVSLPSDYQRGLFMVADDNSDQIYPPRGGGYYDFALFLRHASHKDLTQSGSIYVAAVRGLKLYYQGIPSAAETLTLHFYRKPIDTALYTAATISFDDGGTIDDSASGLGNFEVGQVIDVTDSTNNDTSFTITEAAAGSLTVSESVTTEAAGESITIRSRPDEGIPEHLQTRLLKHYVCKEIQPGRRVQVP